MANKEYKVFHKRSTQIVEGKPKLPTSSELQIGEIAINFAKDYETLSIINNSGETVPFSSDKKLKKTNINIPYVKTDQTTISALLSGTCLDLDSLQEGQSIILHLTSGTTTGSTVFSNSCTLDLKLSDGTYTGPNIIYYGATTKLTTHYPGGNDIRLTFHSGLTIGTATGLTGWWVEGNYTGNDTLPNQLYYFGNIKSGNPGIQRYSLALLTSAGTWTSITTTSVTGATSTASTVGYLPGSDILYYSNTLAAGGDGVYSYGYISIYSLDFRYSSNCLSTLLKGMPVYLVGTIGADGLFYLDRQTWWTQNLPTSEDGKVYIFLGCAYSTYQLSLWAEHPIYQYKNGHIRLYQEDNTPNVITTEEEYSGLTTSGSLIDAYLFKQINDDNELVISEAMNDLNTRVTNLENSELPIIDTIADFSGISETGNLVDAYVVREVFREVEFVTAEALNNLKEKTDTLSSTTQNLDERVTDLENSSVDLSSVASAITLNDTVYTVSGGGVDLGNYIPMTKEFTISSSLNDLNDRIIELSAKTSDTYTKEEIDNTLRVYVKTTQPSTGMLPNTFYDLGTITTNTTFTLDTNVDSSVLNHYYFTFSIGTTIPTLTNPSQKTAWFGGSEPVLLQNSYYEISIINGKAAYIQI